MTSWPISLDDVRAARERLRPYLGPTPLRRYAELDREVGHGVTVLVKHENHQPTNAFKVRNGLSALTAMSDERRQKGVIAATRGNHGQGVAWAAQLLGVPATICVPLGNSPDKNAAMRGLGAELIEYGRDYDETLQQAEILIRERGLTMVHATDDPKVLAGAATITLEMVEQARAQGHALDALVIAVGGGSQAVGALTVVRGLGLDIPVYGVQAANASAIHDSWHAGARLTRDSAATFADGLATRACYDGTFPALQQGLQDFTTVTEEQIAEAVRMLLRTTHNLAEGGGAAGLAGLCKLAENLANKTVAVILSGANIDLHNLRAVVNNRVPAA